MWQAGSLALMAAAIGLAALPLGRILGAGEYHGPKGATVEGGDVKPATMSGTELMRTVDSMRQLAGKIEVVQKDPEPPPVEDTAPTETHVEAAAPPTLWAYIGYMSGGAKRALVRIGPAETGTQMMLKEGQEHEGTKVVEINPDHLIVEKAGARERIDLSQRSTAWDSTPPRRPMAGRPGAPGVQPGMPGGPGANGAQQPNFGNPSAAAMAEAQRRMKAAIAPQPPQTQMDWQKAAKEMGNLSQDKRDALMKVMSEPGLSPEDRNQMLREIGIPVDGSIDDRLEFMKSVGVTPETDPKLYDMIKEGGGAK
jgi:hypothetical protein